MMARELDGRACCRSRRVGDLTCRAGNRLQRCRITKLKRNMERRARFKPWYNAVRRANKFGQSALARDGHPAPL